MADAERVEAPPDSHLRRVLAAWNIGAAAAVAEVPGGATNRVFRVETCSGTWFVRRYAKRDPALAAREHALIDAVRSAGLPAPAPIALAGGGTVLVSEGEVYALYEPAVGRQLDKVELGREHAWACGEMLGRLHVALAARPDAGYVRWSLSWDGAEWLERLSRVEAAIHSAGVRDVTDRHALERVRAQRAWLSDVRCHHAYSAEHASQVTHGDYQNANLFFDDAGVSGIIDWEQAAWMPRAYEAARAVSFIFLPDRERTRTFLEAYSKASGAGAAELADGARAWGAFADHHVWPVEQVYLHENAAARRYIPHAPFRPFAELWAEATD